jgi:hypothetical protein
LQRIENLVFGLRSVILLSLLVFTIIMGYFASQLRMDAGFTKMLPIGHSYIETFFEYSESFGGGNRILVVLENKEGDIFQKDFLYKLNDITQDLFYIPGVARHTVTSLWTPNTRFIAVTEEGLEAGDVIPANFAGTEEDIDTVLQNTLRADLVGRLVSTDFQGAMIRAELLDFNPETQQRLDYFEVARKLEQPLVNVFLPTTPNPTSGFLLFVPAEDVRVLDMSIEEGIKLVVSGGIVTPSDNKAPAPPRDPATAPDVRLARPNAVAAADD